MFENVVNFPFATHWGKLYRLRATLNRYSNTDVISLDSFVSSLTFYHCSQFPLIIFIINAFDVRIWKKNCMFQLNSKAFIYYLLINNVEFCVSFYKHVFRVMVKNTNVLIFICALK